MPIEPRTYSAFALWLANRIVDRASGHVVPDDPIAGDLMLRRPADAYFIGSVGPAALALEQRGNSSPPAIGLDFFVQDLGVVVVSGSFDHYRPELPSLGLCREIARETADADLEIPVVMRKRTKTFEMSIQLEVGQRRLEIEIPNDGADKAYGAPTQGQYRIRKDALKNDEDFRQAQQALNLKPSTLKFIASIVVTVTHDAIRGHRVQVRFVNESFNPRWQSEPRLQRRIDRVEEPFLFDVNLSIKLEGCALVPTTLDLEAQDFRYDNLLWVDGFNTSAEYIVETNSLRTRYAPIAHQLRVKHADGKEDLRFTNFALDPMAQLNALLQQMERYASEWPPSALPDEEQREAENRDRDQFANEVCRFEKGIAELNADPNALKAFLSTMQVFANIWKVRDSSRNAAWRRFQIVFIVSVIGGLCGRAASKHEDLKIVDILWFPTGGGKTEAYLAIMLWQAFFDRLRGKKTGVTAMMRFPLRLLSLQQMQRVIEAVCAADIVRASDPAYDGDQFSVGFLVGSNATRNKLEESDIRQIREQLNLPFEKRSDWIRRHRVVSKCPFCYSANSLDIRIDESNRLVHYCTKLACGRTLPLYVIDDEAYRYLPTVLVGTVDKLALIGQNLRWRQLLGFVDSKCRLHGYTSGEKCAVYPCKERLESVRLFDPAPAIEVQDELHLLREELGVVASHYETVAHAIVEKYGIAPIKVIASTATIQNHKRQAEALYARESRQFPVMGRTLASSFYADVQTYDQRIFIGIMPRRLTHINALMQLMQIEHEFIQGLRRRQILQPIVDETELDQLLDYYEVVVTYTLRRIDQDRVDGSIESQVNPHLSKHGLRPIRNQPMTATTTTEDVTRILAELERPGDVVDDRLSSITATSMISHGVDVDRLNIMNFFGMPFSAAEYIQSSSRVGRNVCGCVFIVYQAHKERERSHYQRFIKYHEFQNRLVEPVPLNRWAARALQFTSPGLVMAAIFAIYGGRWSGPSHKSLWLAKEVLKAFDQRAFSVEEIARALVDALFVEPSEQDAVAEHLAYLMREGLERARIVDSRAGFGSCMAPEPMQSLRDVEPSFNVDVLGPNMWYVEAD